MLAASTVLRTATSAMRVASIGRSSAVMVDVFGRAFSSVAPQVKADAAATPVANNSDAASQFKVSIVKHPFAVPAASNVAAQSVTNSVFAVISMSGTQYKITEGDVIVADKVDNVDIGQIVEINDVLLLGSKNTTVLGRPQVPGAKVKLEVEELTKDKKVMAIKFRRRKNSRRVRGFRRQLTIFRVKEIEVGPDVKADFV